MNTKIAKEMSLIILRLLRKCCIAIAVIAYIIATFVSVVRFTDSLVHGFQWDELSTFYKIANVYGGLISSSLVIILLWGLIWIWYDEAKSNIDKSNL